MLSCQSAQAQLGSYVLLTLHNKHDNSEAKYGQGGEPRMPHMIKP